MIHANPRRWWRRAAVILAAMAAIAATVVYPVAVDDRGTEVTRYRNAFLAERATAADWEWPGDRPPASFHVSAEQVPPPLLAWLAANTPQDAPSDWALARALASRLHGYTRDGGAIADDVVTSLRLMQAKQTGYCADYVRVFEALAQGAGLTTRQWAFAFDGYGGWGHTVNEVWDRRERRWTMVDVFGGFVPTNRAGQPLSALEFRRLLLESPGSIVFDRLHPVRFGFRDDAAALDYYLRGRHEWYLWNGNHALQYDNDTWVQAAGRFGRAPEQVVAMLRGTIAELQILPDPESEAAFAALERTRWRLVAAFAAEVVLGIGLLWCLIAGRRCRVAASQL
ncbi:MAG: hypothetical protein FJ197_10985 [Gammaproteobacteria bacterium]|nr:hypothetical protein [Gammaproteobacteria bacterium]